MKLHHSIAHSLGYELSNIKKHHPTLESHLQIMFNLLNIDLVIDVGANKGQYGIMLRKLGYKGAIYSFEPVQSCFQSRLCTKGCPTILSHCVLLVPQALD